MHEILSTKQMYKADQLAIKTGVSSEELMENAGAGVTAHITANWNPRRTMVFCGPGNNGGDGYVIARHLIDAGWDVTVVSSHDPAVLQGDAAQMYARCPVKVKNVRDLLNIAWNYQLVIDAVFGAGFHGELPKDVQSTFDQAKEKGAAIIAVDVPSGVDGDKGIVCSSTPMAAMTVTFFKPKFGHLLHPARAHCGKLYVVDIGIPATVLSGMDIKAFQNDPSLWGRQFPKLSVTGHKYDRGHAAIVGGGIANTGAARIAARNCLRIGAGAVTLLSSPSALLVYAQALEAIMVSPIADIEMFKEFLTSKRIRSVLIGPANGVNERTKVFTLAALGSASDVVIDADAITVFKDDPAQLFEAIKSKKHGHVVLTPHEAEFDRLFNLTGSALEKCKSATRESGAIVLLKGATTVAAAPDGRVTLNVNAPPWLATAGSGDALAGLITGLMLGFEDPLMAVSAGIWIHSEAAQQFGVGLIAEDIEKCIPRILQEFR